MDSVILLLALYEILATSDKFTSNKCQNTCKTLRFLTVANNELFSR